MKVIKGSATTRRERSSPAIHGHIERISGSHLIGWAQDRGDPTREVELHIRIDGALVGTCLADELRTDQPENGLEIGKHGFSFKIPRGLFDGKEHIFEVIDAAKMQPLSNSPQRTRLPTLASRKGSIDRLEGPFLVGWVSDPLRTAEPVTLIVIEDGKAIAGVQANHIRPDGNIEFWIRLPKEVCDGRPHSFVLQADSQQVAAIAAITPYLLTPIEIFAELGSAELLGTLSVAAGYRYRALQEQLRRVAAAPAKAAQALSRDAEIAHEILLRDYPRTQRNTKVREYSFPEEPTPEATILVPVHNKVGYTHHCLASLRLMPNDTTFEVIVLDDGSTDETSDIERTVSGIRVVHNKVPLGFLRNCNEGAKLARGQFVVLLNNDVEVTPHWLDALLRPFAMFDEVGLVGSKLLFGDGKLQEAGGLVWRDGNAWNYGRGDNAKDPRYNYLRETDYCSGASIALKRSDWEDLGGFDEAYAPAYYEDTDLAFRVRAAGKRVVYQPKSEIFHFEGVSSGTDVRTGVKRYQKLNQPKFLSRWLRDFQGNGTPGDAADFNKERGYSRRALVIDTECPQPNRSAGHYAAIQEIRLLQSLGFKATFVPMNLAHLGHYTDSLEEMGVEYVCAPFVLSVDEFLAARGWEFNLVYVTRYHVAETLLTLLRQYCSRAKIVLNAADLHFLRTLRSAIAESNEAKLAEAITVRDIELDVMRRVDLTLTYSDVEEAVILSHNLNSTRVARCPWVVSPRVAVEYAPNTKTVSFLGGFRHLPNGEAVKYFVTQIMPLVRDRVPGVIFEIYGSFVTPDVMALSSDDVIVKGFVDELADVFSNSRVFVAPLLTGAGIKGKVLDALSFGIPSVLSPLAAEGIGCRDGTECLIRQGAIEWADAIALLLTDDEVWTAMSRSALKFVEVNYSFEHGRILMSRALQEIDVMTLSGMHAR